MHVLVAPLIFLFFVAVVLPALIRFFKPRLKPLLKGWIGETAVNMLLTRQLDQNTYKVVRGVMLPAGDATTQIDHIVASRYGIFVIETKNYKGWIFGSEREPKWTQRLFRVSHRFQNPIRQNYKHIMTLVELTSIPESYFRSVIAFSGGATFKTDMPACVIHVRDLASHIRSYTDVLIQDQQVPEIVTAISAWVGTVSFKKKSMHVAKLRQKNAPVSVAASAPACPKCGETMKLRSRRSDGGQFWGCTTYPRCRGIRTVA